MRGTLAALAVALLLSGAAAVPAGAEAPAVGPAATEDARPPVATLAAHVGGERRVLTDDAILPARGWGSADRIRKWPGKRIPYYESIPKKWDWSLQQAVDHWNSSGGGIKFVKVPRRKAKLVISYGDTGGADGVGTLGYQYRNFVYLSPAYKKADQFDPETRVWVGRLFTHELGHVLGFNHTSGQCALMYPVYNFGVCPPLPDDAPGYYHCRWIDKKLLKRFTRMYGGRPKRPPRLCLIEQLPPELRGLAFGGGATEGKPVRVTWQPPAGVRDGTKVFVTVWRGTACAEPPDRFEDRVAVDPKAGSWTDPAYGQGTWCYLVQIQNRYGASRAAVGRALTRFAPVPAAPTVAVAWHDQDAYWLVGWAPPDADTTLYAMRNNADPTTCPTTYDPDTANSLYQAPSGHWLMSPWNAEECVSLFAVTEWDTVSPPTQLFLQVPEPTVTPTVGSVTPYAEDPYAASTTVSLPSNSYYLRIEVVPGACPGGTITPPGDAEWYDGYQDWNDPQRWYFYPEPWDDTGPQCAMFAAFDEFDRHGPVVGRTFTVAP